MPKLGTEASFGVNTSYTTTSRSWAAATASAGPTRTCPLFVDLYLAGRLKLDELVTKTYPLEDFQTRASTTCTTGELARGVLTF